MVAGWSYMSTCNLQRAVRERTIWWVYLIYGPCEELYFMIFPSFNHLRGFSCDFWMILMVSMYFSVELLPKGPTNLMDWWHLWISILTRLFENRISNLGGRRGVHVQSIQLASNFVGLLIRHWDNFPQILVRYGLMVHIFFGFEHHQSH